MCCLRQLVHTQAMRTLRYKVQRPKDREPTSSCCFSFGARPHAQEPACIGEPSKHTTTLSFCALVGRTESVKVTTIGEKVAAKDTYVFCSRTLSFALYAESNKAL